MTVSELMSALGEMPKDANICIEAYQDGTDSDNREYHPNSVEAFKSCDDDGKVWVAIWASLKVDD